MLLSLNVNFWTRFQKLYEFKGQISVFFLQVICYRHLKARIPFKDSLFFLWNKPCLIGSEDVQCSQGNQGELLITTAPAGVEQRMPQAAESWVSTHYNCLSLSAAVFWISFSHKETIPLKLLLHPHRNLHDKDGGV